MASPARTGLGAALRGGNLGREVMAGLTLLAISVPLNIGYAQVAGLPPTAGLYALVLPTIVYAVLASSKQVVASPDAAAAALVFSSLIGLQSGAVDLPTLAAAQALVGGLILIAAGVFRLGFLASFLSAPILVGFVAGLALEILVSQVGKMLGVRIPSGSEFLESCRHILTSLGETNPWSVAIAVVTLAILLVGRRLSRVVPWALAALVVATVATVVGHLDDRGVAVLGTVEAGLPSLGLPKLDLDLWLAVLPSAAALSMITMAEGLLIGRSYAARNHYEVAPDRDLVAFGAANLAAGVSSSFTMGSSTSRTAAMDAAGSRSQVPSIVLAAGAATLLLVGTDAIAAIPSPAIGAIVTVAIIGLLGIEELTHIWRTSRPEFLVAMACLLGVLLAGPLRGLILAFVLSLINLTRRAAAAPVDVTAGEEFVDLPEVAAAGVKVVRMAAPLFFANAAALGEAVRAAPEGGARAVVLDFEGVTDIDLTGGDELAEALAALRAAGVPVVYTRVRGPIRDLLARRPDTAEPPEYATNRAAVAALVGVESLD